ncbi:MAG: ABC transporter ATP-binding protein, partial [Clostridia bacterium]|nr:ABC transporter ATP-binding protein [Clostridia bacterium]
FIIATHSPILLGYPGAEILSFDDTGIHARTWEETESYRITKLFIENRDRLLQRMFESEDE